MKRKALALSLTFALLFSTVAGTQLVNFAFAQSVENITIDTDGSVTPSTAPIKRIGDVYLVTSDTGSIFIRRSNMALDGQGHRIQGEIHLPIGSTPFTQVNEVGGIRISNTKNVTVKNFSIENCSFGVSLDNCSHTTLCGLDITGAWNDMPFSTVAAGILIWQSTYNNITGNHFDYNEDGVYLGEHSEYNTLVDNTIIGNRIGISFFDSSNNVFYHNNFNNTSNFYDSGLDHYNYPSTNSWDNGKEGNYWSDYTGTDQNNDGIGDTPYKANAQNIDNYPLIEAFNRTYYLLKINPPKLSFLSPLNTVYNESSLPLLFTVDKQVNWMGYSLDCQDNITVMGNVTLSELTNGVHNITVYAEDTFGNEGASETIIFNINVALPTTLVVASVITVAVVGIGLLVYFKKRKH